MSLLLSGCCEPCCDCAPACPPKAEATSLEKFSGSITIATSPQVNFLGDSGAVTIGATPVLYPAARRGRLKNLAVNIQASIAVVPAGASIVIDLLRNGSPVDVAVGWFAGEPLGITKSIRSRRVRVHRNDVLALRVTCTTLATGTTLNIGATLSLGEELGREFRRDRRDRRDRFHR